MSKPAKIVDDRIVITPADRTNPLWHKLMRMWQERLNELRMQNDKLQPEESTAMLRGRIAEIKAMIGKDDEPIIE